MLEHTMNTTHFHCAHCNIIHTRDQVDFATDGKAIACAAGLALGASTKNVWLAIGLAALGLIVGHMIDEEISPRCPVCGAVLKAVLTAAFRGQPSVN